MKHLTQKPGAGPPNGLILSIIIVFRKR